MNENPFKKSQTQTLEGRLYDQGKDLGDKLFHEKFMDMAPDSEEQRLKELIAFVAENKKTS
jgi:dsDNA-binding SOS-regulon protein